MSLNLIGFINDHDNKGFLNSPSKLPCYRNIFYISPVSSSTFLFFFCSSSFVYIQQKPIPLCWWGGGPKRVHKWVWTSRKPSQQTVMGWPGHCYLMKIFKWFVLFINFLLVGIGDLPYKSSSNLEKNFEVRKTRPSFPRTMRSVHMYVKLVSSWNFLWPKLEWKVVWSLPLYFLSLLQVFNFPLFPSVSTSSFHFTVLPR